MVMSSWCVAVSFSRHGWTPQTAAQSCGASCGTRCPTPTAWITWSTHRKRSECRDASSTPWSVSCLRRIHGRGWQNSNRAAMSPQRYVDVSSRMERRSTPAGQAVEQSCYEPFWLSLSITLSIENILDSSFGLQSIRTFLFCLMNNQDRHY